MINPNGKDMSLLIGKYDTEEITYLPIMQWNDDNLTVSSVHCLSSFITIEFSSKEEYMKSKIKNINKEYTTIETPIFKLFRLDKGVSDKNSLTTKISNNYTTL